MSLLNHIIAATVTTTCATFALAAALVLRTPIWGPVAVLLALSAVALVVTARRRWIGPIDPPSVTSPDAVAIWETLPDRPAWATSENRYGPDHDRDDIYGSWDCKVPNSPGPMSIEQHFFLRHGQRAWEVSPPVWMPGSAHDDGHSAEECRMLAAGLMDAADLIDRANAEATGVSA